MNCTSPLGKFWASAVFGVMVIDCSSRGVLVPYSMASTMAKKSKKNGRRELEKGHKATSLQRQKAPEPRHSTASVLNDKGPDAKPERDRLQGWSAIAKFLGQTPAVAQRWQESGMPVVRSGRHVYALPEELTRWVGTEAGKSKPVHIAMDEENLLADLKEGLAYVRRGKGGKK
jgi:hypothetical protein